MSQTAGSTIYSGPWINWSHGTILGSTITLSQRDGGLLTSFLALFVATAGGACWRIISYALHQHRASQEYQDGIHHQQQAILRNTGSPGTSSWQLVQLIWYWRKNAAKPLLRTLPLALLALLNFTLFGVAGIFSSEVTKAAGNETLIRSPSCGMLNLTEVGTKDSDSSYASVDLNDTLAATTYSRACYDNTQNFLQCSQYIQQMLPWTANQNASCPFTADICSLGPTAAYQMDSGLLGSHDALGINSPRSDRVQYRKVTTCSPLVTKGYAVPINNTDPSEEAYGDLLIQYFYGPVVGVNNYTWQYDTHTLIENSGYDLESLIAVAGNAANSWIPVPALNRTDADVSLFLLAPNSVIYEDIVTDPLYAASNPYELPNESNTANLTYYSPDKVVSALGCIDQHQFCNPVNGRCTKLSSSAQQIGYFKDIGLNDAQLVTTWRIQLVAGSLSSYGSVHSRGANALRASETVNSNIQIPLPNNQWMIEVSSWYAVSMAKLQQKIVEYATGPAWIPTGYELTGPQNKYQERMCKNQKVRNASGTISFSVLGVAIILVIGTILILMNLVLDTAMGFIRRRFHWKAYKSMQWSLDEKLQLQRLAYEEAGQGQWSGATDVAPVTRKGDKFGIPAGVDPKHPRLGKAPRQFGSPEETVPEAEGLMEAKGVGYRADAVPAWQS